MHSACRHVDGRRAVRCLQHYGNAYLHPTVSVVSELLGGTFALALIKVYNSDTLGLGDLINTDKALSVIMAIFVSVAIAFFFGMLVQWLGTYRVHLQLQEEHEIQASRYSVMAATSIICVKLMGAERQLIHDP